MEGPLDVLDTPSIRELMRRLRRGAPLSKPVRLVQRPGVRMDGRWVLGYAGYRLRRGRVVSFRIVVDSRLPPGEKWDVVVHEWAHCLDRERRPRCRDPHDSRWGQHYARAWRASMEL